MTETAAPNERMSLDAWATEQSRGDRRVELLNAFVASERNAEDAEMVRSRAEWAARYAAFANRPL